MNKFKKGGGRKSGRELLLPAESGYLRACAHHFAERLGLQHLSMGEGQARRVLLQLPERPRGANKGASSSAAVVSYICAASWKSARSSGAPGRS